MSNWRDTVMSDIQSEDLMDRNSAHPIKTQVRLVKKAQAEISFPLGEVLVAKAVLAIIENPKQANYRLKEIAEWCETKVDATTSDVV